MKANSADLAAVATSGAYSDLSGVPTNISSFTNDAGYLTQHQDISGKANSADLATVATSGSYEDLSNKPTIPDIQIDGTSIVDNGVANIPKSGASLGLVRINSDRGINISDGLIFTNKATASNIKTGTDQFRPIVPQQQHTSTFYGLAKAAGDSTQSASDNAVGTYTADAKAAIQSMLDVPSNSTVTGAIATAIGNVHQFDIQIVQSLPTQDIQEHTVYFVPKTGDTNDVYDEYIYVNDAWEMIGNTQIDLSNYVQKTDYASADTAGVVYIDANRTGLTMWNDPVTGHPILTFNSANTSDIKDGVTPLKPLTPARQHESLFYGLAKAAGDTTQSQSDNAVGTYTDNAKTAIRTMLGAAASSDIPSVPVQDVQVNGTSIVANNIASVPLASTSTPGINGSYGLVRTKYDYGCTISYDGYLTFIPSNANEIKSGTTITKMINPYNQHRAVFYGLAKASGDTSQASSSNEVGVYTADAKGSIQKMLGITDLLAPEENDLTANQAYSIGDIFVSNGKMYKATAAIAQDATIIPTTNCEEVTVASQFVKKTDFATESKGGIIRTSQTFGTEMYGEQLRISGAPTSHYKAGGGNWRPVVPSHQHESVFYGLSKVAGVDLKDEEVTLGTYPSAAKTAIQDMLGVADVSQNVIVPGEGVGSAKLRNYIYSGIQRTQQALGVGSFAKGMDTIALGNYSHADGYSIIAFGEGAHAYGTQTFAFGKYSFAEGFHSYGNFLNLTSTVNELIYNYSAIIDVPTNVGIFINNMAAIVVSTDTVNKTVTLSNTLGTLNNTRVKVFWSAAIGDGSHVEGRCTVAKGNYQHVQGNCNSVDEQNLYADIVGNGTTGIDRSNAYALTWTGTGRYAGDVYVGCNNDSTGGTRLATVTEVAAKLDAAEAGMRVVRLI